MNIAIAPLPDKHRPTQTDIPSIYIYIYIYIYISQTCSFTRYVNLHSNEDSPAAKVESSLGCTRLQGMFCDDVVSTAGHGCRLLECSCRCESDIMCWSIYEIPRPLDARMVAWLHSFCAFSTVHSSANFAIAVSEIICFRRNAVSRTSSRRQSANVPDAKLQCGWLLYMIRYGSVALAGK